MFDVTAPCAFNLRHFPNDVHNCSVSLASSQYTNQVSAQPESDYRLNFWLIIPEMIDQEEDFSEGSSKN